MYGFLQLPFKSVLIVPSAWVCYVYQNRYIAPRTDDDQRSWLRLYDFDPLRVRKEKCDRLNQPESDSPPSAKRRSILRRSSSTASSHPIDGDRDGITLVTAETVLPALSPLMEEIRTGKHLAYMYVEKPTSAHVALLDGERIGALKVSGSIFEEEGPGRGGTG